MVWKKCRTIAAVRTTLVLESMAKDLPHAFPPTVSPAASAGHGKRHERSRACRGCIDQQHAAADGRRGGAGDDAADIADHVVAERRHAPGVSDQLQRLRRFRHLARRHRVKRLFVRRRHRNADDIKHNADGNDADENHKRQHRASRLRVNWSI